MLVKHEAAIVCSRSNYMVMEDISFIEAMDTSEAYI